MRRPSVAGALSATVLLSVLGATAAHGATNRVVAQPTPAQLAYVAAICTSFQVNAIMPTGVSLSVLALECPGVNV